MKLAKTVLEATLTVARLACQSRGNVMANLTLKSNPQFSQRKIISPSRQRHTLPVFFRTPDCGLSITFVVARQRCKLGGTS